MPFGYAPAQKDDQDDSRILFVLFISPVTIIITPDLSNASNLVSIHQYADGNRLCIGTITNLSTLVHKVASIESCPQGFTTGS